MNWNQGLLAFFKSEIFFFLAMFLKGRGTALQGSYSMLLVKILLENI